MFPSYNDTNGPKRVLWINAQTTCSSLSRSFFQHRGKDDAFVAGHTYINAHCALRGWPLFQSHVKNTSYYFSYAIANTLQANAWLLWFHSISLNASCWSTWVCCFTGILQIYRYERESLYKILSGILTFIVSSFFGQGDNDQLISFSVPASLQESTRE